MHILFFVDLAIVIGMTFLVIVSSRELALKFDGSGRLNFAQGWVGFLLCASMIPLGIVGCAIGIEILIQDEMFLHLISQI